MRAPLKNTFHQSLGRQGHVRAEFDVNVGLLGSIMVVWREFAGKVEDENHIAQSDIQTTEPQHLLRSSLSWPTCHGGS